MNTKKGTKSKLLAVLLAVFSVIALLCTMPHASVSADSEPLEDSPHECDESCYTNIYFISDDRESEAYVDGFLNDVVDAYAARHTVFNQFYYIETYSDPYRLEFELAASPSGTIANSLIIFENRDGFCTPDANQYDGDIPHWQIARLSNLFSMFKASNCKIMYICGTDEDLFCDYDKNSFLDYVDIHINIDMFCYFTDTFFQMLYENDCRQNDDDYKQIIILDKGMSTNCMNIGPQIIETEGIKYYNPRDFCGYVLPEFLKENYGISLSSRDTICDLLKLLNLDVLCHLGENLFYNMRDTGQYQFMSGSEIVEMYAPNRIYYVGVSWWYDNSFELEWLLSELDNVDSVSLDTYLFIEGGCYDNDREDSGIYKFDYAFGLDRFEKRDYLIPRINDFIMGNDLNKYDNWEGRCIVTSKPITLGNGWVHVPLSSVAKKVFGATKSYIVD